MDTDLPGLRLRPELLAAGSCDEDLRRMQRRGELTRVRRGAYVAASDERLRRGEARHALAARAAAAQLPPGAVISHVSAAVLHGLPVWGVALDRVHATRSRSSGGRLGRTLHLHTAPLRGDEVTDVDGVPVTTCARTLGDLGRTSRFDRTVAMADAALFSGAVDRPELERTVERAARRPGNRDARRMVAFADRGGQSVGESRSRVLMERFRLPRPVLQWEVPARRWVGRTDFAWPELRTVGEFDGRISYGRLLRPGRTPADAVFEERRREDAIRDAGFRVVRWVWDDLDDFGDVVERLWAAFRAGCRGLP